LDRIRVLLADDHEAMLDRVVRLLETECNVVGTATDGQQALEAAQDLKPDVLVLDVSMPVMNGIETAHRLKEAGAEARIVFLTVHDDPDFAKEALEAGALGYVIKSRIVSDLMIAINEVCAGRSFVSPMSPQPARPNSNGTGLRSE
jgi:DNA-binding NarL/FixJ family response regulator